MEGLELIAVRVKDGIFVGNVTAAEDKEFLSMNKITHIINTTGGEVANLFMGDSEFKYVSFPWKDTPGSVCTTILFDPNDESINRAVQFIDEAVDCGNCVLVHSYYGISRSPTLVVAYLMIKYGWKLESALAFLRMSHPDMLIKPHFLRQLRLFAKRHHNDYDVFDKEVDDSEFGLDNDQWMLRNTFLNGLCFQEQQINELYQECTAKIDVGTRIHTGKKKTRVLFVDSDHKRNVDVDNNTRVMNTKSIYHIDPFADAVSENLAGSRGLLALSSGERSVSIMSRSTSPCTRRLESDPVTCPKGRGLLGLAGMVSKEGKSSDSFHTTTTMTQNFTRSNSKQFSFLKSDGDEARENQIVSAVVSEDPLPMPTTTSALSLSNYECLAPSKSGTTLHHSPYAKLTPKNIYRKGSPLPIQSNTHKKASQAKHSSVLPSRPSRNQSPSPADFSASNRASAQKINSLSSLTPNRLNAGATVNVIIRSTAAITRSASSDYVSIAPRRAVGSSSARPVGGGGGGAHSAGPAPTRGMVPPRPSSPSAPIPQLLTKSRSPCARPGPPPPDGTPRLLKRKPNDPFSTRPLRNGSPTGGATQPPKGGGGRAPLPSEASSSATTARKAPSLSAPVSGILRREPLTSIPSRRK